MYNKRTPIAALCCGLLLSCYTPKAIAADHDHAHHADGVVLLPQQMSTVQHAYIAPAQAANAHAWNSFTGKNGSWTVLLDKTTGTPHEAFGSPVKITGYNQITESNIEQAAQAFLQEYKDVLRVDPDQVRLISKTFVNNRWYVSYMQTVGGVDVLLSEVRLRIFANGNVIAFGADYYPALKPLAPASLSWQQAAAQAGTGLQAPVTAALSVLPSNATATFVLPLKKQDAIDYRLVYKVPVRSGRDSYVAYVDAHTGNVLWRYTTSHNASTEVIVQGGIKAVTPMDDETVVGFPYQYVTVDGQQYTTDGEGKLNIDINSAGQVSATLDGPYAVVRRNSGTNAAFSGTWQSGTPTTLDWNNDNSNTLERNMFYHANAIRSFFKELDPSLTVVDRPIYIDLQYGGSEVNAYSNGDSITFLAVDNSSARMAEGPSVLYHEYGHSLNQLLYEELGKGGMVNMACHEGTADVVSTLLLDDPRIGYGVFTDDSERFIRNVQNDMIYPDSAVGESHNDGLILAGAFWDLRNYVSLEYARRIAHFARYGTPDDPDDGIAFRRWFIETLIADDDDGNLANGTPHMTEIVRAFNRHRIGSNLLLAQGFSHEPYADTKTTTAPYAINFELGAGALGAVAPDSVAVVYSTDDFATFSIASAQLVGSNSYTASIPAQPKGTIVKYYIRAWDVLGKTMLRFASDASAQKPYTFLVGYSVSMDENFEKERGWVIGGNGDNTQTGKWERAIPQEIDFRDFGGFYLQPGTDHSGEGRCFVTGARGGFNFQQGLLMGQTTMTSPAYDLSKLENPVIRFYRWFANINLTGGTKSTAFLRTEISTDDGATWTGVDTITVTNADWEKIIIRVPEFAKSSTTFRVRFIANAPTTQTAEEARFVKALVDDVNILTTNDIIITDVIDHTESEGHLSNFPNPFSSATTLRYAVEKAGVVRIAVYSLTGTEVATLANGYNMPGDYAIEWNGTDKAGNAVAPGVYVVRYQNGETVISRTLVRY